MSEENQNQQPIQAPVQADPKLSALLPKKNNIRADCNIVLLMIEMQKS
ncbi:MAG: hypothetical protein LUF83_10970 [Alistipes sp.]|nr:hypothetical protein [Alistipes sp.]